MKMQIWCPDCKAHVEAECKCSTLAAPSASPQGGQLTGTFKTQRRRKKRDEKTQKEREKNQILFPLTYPQNMENKVLNFTGAAAGQAV